MFFFVSGSVLVLVSIPRAESFTRRVPVLSAITPRIKLMLVINVLEPLSVYLKL